MDRRELPYIIGQDARAGWTGLDSPNPGGRRNPGFGGANRSLSSANRAVSRSNF
jgi:hypothetical protein